MAHMSHPDVSTQLIDSFECVVIHTSQLSEVPLPPRALNRLTEQGAHLTIQHCD